MRCKAGDLAIVVSSPVDPSYVGTIVSVLYLLHPDSRGIVRLGDAMFRHHSGGSTTDPTWAVKSLGRKFKLHTGAGVLVVPCGDSCLRPIRDGDGVDETLRGLGLAQ